MGRDFRYIFEGRENELLNVAHEAIECAIASAYLNVDGVAFLSKVAKRLAEFATAGCDTLVKVIVSDKFAATAEERLRVLGMVGDLPGVEVRVHCDAQFQHRKNFIFRTKEEIRVVVGSVNVTSAGLFKNLEIATLAIHDTGDPEAMKVISEFESMWDSSKPLKEYMEVEAMPESIPRFAEGQNVRYISTGKIGTVNKVIEGDRGYSYRVTIDGKVRTIGERFLEPVVDYEQRLIEDFLAGHIGGHDDYNLYQTWFRLTRPVENNLYSYLASKTIFNPYQFKPLLRFLSVGSDERLFIADEVGVGKTIEAGIILTELLARERLDVHKPIFIICPYSLGPKWVTEMKDRFGLHFHLHDSKSLRYTLEATLQDGIFPAKYAFSVVGLQLVRRSEYLALLKELDERKQLPLFEMVIVDEAHHMRNPETDSNRLGHVLTNMTEMMLLLSATPLNLRSEDLYNQMNILNPWAFPDKSTFETLQAPVIKLNRIRRLLASKSLGALGESLSLFIQLAKDPLGHIIYSHPEVRDLLLRLSKQELLRPEEIVQYDRLLVSLSPLYHSFTRTRKREALEHQVQREAWEIPITLSQREFRFHNKVLAAVERYYLSQGGDPRAIAFVTNTHRRMLSSCIPAMVEYLEWCIRENRVLVMDERSMSEEVEDNSQVGTEELDPVLADDYKRLLAEARELETMDSKYQQFRQMLDRVLSNPETPQVIVFSFFVRTLEYLKRRLEAEGYKVAIIHGEIPLESDRTRPDRYGRYEIMNEFKKGRYTILLSSEVGGEGLDFQYCHAIINYDLPYNPMRIEQRIGRIDRFGQKADKIVIANLFIEGTIDEEIYDRLYRRIRLVEDGVGALEPILGKQLADIQTAIISGKLTQEQKDELSRRLAEAVAAAKLEMEEFERHRNELLGDDYLAERINNITTGSFVSPEDAIRLTDQCLSQWEGCRFVREGEACGEIALSAGIISKLEQFLRRPGNEAGYSELQPLLSPSKSINAVFDGSVAQEYSSYIFLPPTGYWSRFLTYQLEQDGRILKTFSFAASSAEVGLPKGEYVVFLFEVRLEGIRREIEFLGVPVNIASSSVLETDFGNLPRLLANAAVPSDASTREELDLEQCLDSARDYFDQFLEEKRVKSDQKNRYLIESRVAAIQRSSDMKARALQQQLESHIQKRKEEGKAPDENYLRLTRGHIEKEKARPESRIKELRNRQELSLDYSLEGIAHLSVRED